VRQLSTALYLLALTALMLIGTATFGGDDGAGGAGAGIGHGAALPVSLAQQDSLAK
jgi:hypothetical protein